MHFPARVLQALSHSTSLEPLVRGSQARGSVHSVFPRAANLQVGQRLLTLHARATPCAPNGIILPVSANERPLADLHTGLTVLIQRGTLAFPARGIGLSLHQSQPWNPRPTIPPASCPAERLERNLGQLTQFLLDKAPSPSPSPSQGLAQLALLADAPDRDAPASASPLVQKAWPATRSLLQALAQQQSESAAAAAQALIGLGPGLTPSGDDLLISLIASTLLLSEALGMDSGEYQRFGSKVLAHAQHRTTLLSVNWIEYAARGQVSETLGRLLQALALGDRPSLLEASANEVFSSGATSGGDLLAGVILGSRCLLTHATRAR
jgi:hypothetical protein